MSNNYMNVNSKYITKEKERISLFIGTPAYGSMVHTDYLHSLMSYHERKIPFTTMTIGNESLITRGRNTILSYFHIMAEFTHLFFLDADIYLHADGLIQLLSRKKDVIAAPVALKGFDADGNPVYNIGKILEECNDGLIKVDRVGTAVFILSRKACNTLVEKAISDNDVYYSNKHTRGDAQQINMYDVFKTGVFDNEYYSEDFYVAKVLRELGFDVFVDTTVPTKHNGMYVFGT